MTGDPTDRNRRYIDGWEQLSVAVLGFFFVSVLLVGITVPVAGSSENATAEERPIDIETDNVNVYLQSQKTVVDYGDTLVFTHSATNYITNDEELTIQLIIDAPSGSDVTGTADVDAGSGSQFVSTTTLEPGEQESQRIHVDLHEPGEYELSGEAIYYFGNDSDSGEGVSTTIPIEQRPPPLSTTDGLVYRGTGIASTIPETYHGIATNLESRAEASGDNSIIALYAAGCVALGTVIVIIVSPVIEALTGKNVALGLRTPMMMGDSTVWMALCGAGIGLYLLDTEVSSGGANAETLWTAHVLSGLAVTAVVAAVLSTLVLTKAHLFGKLLAVKSRLLSRLLDR